MRILLTAIISLFFLRHQTCSLLLAPPKERRKTLRSTFLPFPETSKSLKLGEGEDHDRLQHHVAPVTSTPEKDGMSSFESVTRKLAMVTYIASMCTALPLSLFPIWLLYKFQLIDDSRREQMALDMGQSCARGLLYIMPFLQMDVKSDAVDEEQPPEPSIWVCNHTSMLDTFVLLACDVQLRGQNKRPIKAIYWKGLEDNPITSILFQLCGFIPVKMEANGSGVPNEYDIGSFKTLLRNSKKAFAEGFDILILPEGQLNPCPESGLLEVFPGAHKLSLMSKRPIRMVALHGLHKMWHADESIGTMRVTGKEVKVRAYPKGRVFESGDEFVETFRTVVGHFGADGVDLPEEQLKKWLDGTAWKEKKESADKFLNEKRKLAENVEKHITSLLERGKSSNLVSEHEARLEIGSRFPVGVHTFKQPLVRHELVPANKSDLFQETVEHTNECPALPQKGDTPKVWHVRFDDVEHAILSTLERENQSVFKEDMVDDSNESRQSLPIGVHRCKPPLTRHSLVPRSADT